MAGIKIEGETRVKKHPAAAATEKPMEIDLSWSSSSCSSSSDGETTEPMSDADGVGFVAAAAAPQRLPSPASSSGFDVSDGDSGLDGF